MDKNAPMTTGKDDPPSDIAKPVGEHALEVAARHGLGPLSPNGEEVWHGWARPCVSCGQLVERDTDACEHCGQDMTDDMIERMASHAGPLYVLEHVRPFPGVTLERIIRQIRRGVLTHVSIVRGPETNHQWRFSVETPGLCRYFGRCWNCHEEVKLADTHCPTCRCDLRFKHMRALAAAAARRANSMEDTGELTALSPETAPVPRPSKPREGSPAASTGEIEESSTNDAAARADALAAVHTAPGDLGELTDALKQAGTEPGDAVVEGPPRVAGLSVIWIAAGLVIIALVVLMLVNRRRDRTIQNSESPTASLVMPSAAQTPEGVDLPLPGL